MERISGVGRDAGPLVFVLPIGNLHDAGQIKVEYVQAIVEPDSIYPLLRGRDFGRWYAEPSASIIPANQTDKLAGGPESETNRR